MKKFKLLLCGMMVAGFAFTSCSDDDSAPTQQASLTGKWYYSQQGISAFGVDNLQNYSGHAAGCTKDNMELTADGAWKEYDYSASPQCTESVMTSTYTTGNSSITFGTGESAETYEIESLTENTLRIRQAYTQSGQTYYDVETYTRN
jgi:hypothetical protein